ncbi:fungal-specific transcription factor domain-containing protein [Mariannaea sp. PMI_226]|nr:fungal-specific transcription factor domain-containing protein [Mariannaea sp. PMI_226]
MPSSGVINKRTGHGRRKERTMVACIACKQRKQKCDGQSPACRHCVRAGQVCLVEDPVTKQQKPRAYLQFLEERVATLEMLLQENHADMQRDHFNSSPAERPEHGTETTADRAEETAPSKTPSQEQIAYRRDEIRRFEGGDNDNDLSCNINTDDAPRHHELSPEFASSLSITSSLQRVQLQGPGMSMGGISDPLLTSQQLIVPCPLPRAEVGTILLRAYFDEVHPQYPILHRDTILQWERTVSREVPSGREASQDHIMMYFLNMVYAISSLVLQYNGEGSAKGFLAAAQQHQDYVIQLNSVESVQAILCHALYSLYSPVGVSVWSLSGLALRQCIELGFHRMNRRFYPKENLLRSELRKRVFWCSYSMDRAAAMTLGRPFGVSDDDIDIELPLDIDDNHITSTMVYGQPRVAPNEPATALSAAIHTFRLRRIWSKIQRVHYSIAKGPISGVPITEALRSELDEWHACTPKPLQPSTPKLSVFGSCDWFQIAFDHSILLLYCPQIVSSDPSETISLAPYHECIRASKEISELYRRIFITNAASCSWGSLHILFFAGLTYIYCLWSSTAIREAVTYHDIYKTCTSCTVVLSLMAERWKAAAPHRDLFDLLANRTVYAMSSKGCRGWSKKISVDDASNGGYTTQAEPLIHDCVTQIALSGMSMGVERLISEFQKVNFLQSTSTN